MCANNWYLNVMLMFKSIYLTNLNQMPMCELDSQAIEHAEANLQSHATDLKGLLDDKEMSNESANIPFKTK